MSDYQLNLTPSFRTPNTEGYMDTSILNGVSVQRTGYIEVYNSIEGLGQVRKVIEIADGTAFDNDIDITYFTPNQNN